MSLQIALLHRIIATEFFLHCSLESEDETYSVGSFCSTLSSVVCVQ